MAVTTRNSQRLLIDAYCAAKAMCDCFISDRWKTFYQRCDVVIIVTLYFPENPTKKGTTMRGIQNKGVTRGLAAVAAALFAAAALAGCTKLNSGPGAQSVPVGQPAAGWSHIAG